MVDLRATRGGVAEGDGCLTWTALRLMRGGCGDSTSKTQVTVTIISWLIVFTGQGSFRLDSIISVGCWQRPTTLISSTLPIG